MQGNGQADFTTECSLLG